MRSANIRKQLALAALAAIIAIAEESSAASIVTDAAATRLQVTERGSAGPKPRLILYTTMATWCVPCRAELPQFAYLRSVFKPEELGMFGLPYDEKDGAEKLNAWAATNHPAYDLLAGLAPDKIASVKSMVLITLRMDAVPASIVTDTDGRILRTKWGPPSVSELRELLWSQKDRK